MTAPPPSASPCAVSVSIINYRTAEMTIRCVESALADLDGVGGGDPIDGHVVVVDNRSGDGSADAIAAWIDRAGVGARVTLVRSATNSGFSGGHNQGVAARRAEAYLVLNSDALVRPGAVGALLAALRADPGLGIVGPRIEHEDGAPQISCFRFPSPWSELARGAGIAALDRALSRRAVAIGIEPDPAEIEWTTFACVLLRGSMAEAVGPMDEGYFMYFEDADYCLRAARAGWRVGHAPQARVVHFRGGSAPVKKLAAARKRLPGYFYAARTRFLHAAHGRAGLLAANLAWVLGRGLSFLKLLAGRTPRRVEREALDMWINVLDPRGDRRAPADAQAGPVAAPETERAA